MFTQLTPLDLSSRKPSPNILLAQLLMKICQVSSLVFSVLVEIRAHTQWLVGKLSTSESFGVYYRNSVLRGFFAFDGCDRVHWAQK